MPGKNHTIAETLKRNPVFWLIIRQVTEVIEDEALEGMFKVAEADKDYQEIVTTIHSGSYEGKNIKNLHKSHPAWQYCSQWDLHGHQRHIFDIPWAASGTRSSATGVTGQSPHTTYQYLKNAHGCTPGIFFAWHDKCG